MIENRNFIITGLQHWDIAIGSNAKDIALEISKNNRVLYINTPLDIKSYFWESRPENAHRKQVIKSRKATIREIKENLWVLDYPFTILPISFLPDGILFDKINQINNKRMYSFVNNIANELGFTNSILFTDNDIYRSFYAKKYLKPDLSIYYRRDNLLAFDFWKKHACRLEPALINKSDIVVCNSEELADFSRRFNKQSVSIGQGVDLSRYNIDNNFTIPEDIKHIQHPIIGYLGDITSLRLDVELIFGLAKNNPRYSFVLVGGFDKVFESHTLKELPNVHFLGSKPPVEVPNYINSFDICMNPQKINEITIGNYPRKIDEFLALGKPTIATETKTMSIFREHVFLCRTIEDYQNSIQMILAGKDKSDKQEKVNFAHSHSWENSVAELYKSIEKYTTNK